MSLLKKSFFPWRVVVHIAFPLCLSFFFFVGSLYRLYSFRVHDGDYGIFTNILWNFANGNGWRCSLYEGEVRVNFLADHFAMLVAPLSPLFKLFPSLYTLSVLHSLAFSVSFFLVPFLVKEIWRAGGRKDYLPSALFLMSLLAFYKPFIASWLFQAHMTTLVVPFAFATLLLLHKQRLFWAAVCAVIVALAQERAVVAVFGLGMYAFGITRNRRLGAALCIASAAYFFAIVKFIIPSFYQGQGAYYYNSFIRPFSMLGEKLLFCFSLLYKLFFLPVLGKNALWACACALPVLGIALVSSRDVMLGFAYHYQDLPSVFLFTAAVHGLLWLQAQAFFKRLRPQAVLLAVIVCMAIAGQNTWRASPFKVVLGIRPDAAVTQLHAELAPFLHLPEHIHVYSDCFIGPQLSLRKYRFQIVPWNVEQTFTSSIVLVGTHQVPFDKYRDAIAKVGVNKSLTLVKQTDVLSIYLSNDLLGTDLYTQIRASDSQ
ncbi:DUF2079 domain-containing protein [Desulfovibrio cuneatus]|uniref:DUF2079 domain-containing protein n=1 Tax=Desulfovibrio cuneatus TaxID=159728 RepID=UPI0003F88F1A|nr:DUF2079 domain-containing protein [Desulfovibrio cuneatus]